jgi:hypothetical protein
MRLTENFRSRAKLTPDLNGCLAVDDVAPELLFASIAAFVASEPLDEPTCLVL